MQMVELALVYEAKLQKLKQIKCVNKKKYSFHLIFIKMSKKDGGNIPAPWQSHLFPDGLLFPPESTRLGNISSPCPLG